MLPEVPAQAIFDALVAHGLPKRLRRSPYRQLGLRDIQPPWLEEAWTGVLDRLPVGYRNFASRILVIAPLTSTDPIPSSASRGQLSRRIEVPPEFYWVVHDCALLWHSIEPAVSHALEGTRWPQLFEADGLTAQTWAILEETATAAALAGLHNGVPPQTFDSMQRLATTLAAPGVRARSDDPCGCEALPEDSELLIKSVSQHALKFVIAHEAGHHMLNHLSHSSDVAGMGARREVEAWLRQAKIVLPPRLKRPQVRELHCDVFAFSAVSTIELNPHAHTEAGHLFTNVVGTQIALVALDLLRVFSTTVVPDDPRTHPSVRQRAVLLIEMMRAHARDNGLNETQLARRALE